MDKMSKEAMTLRDLLRWWPVLVTLRDEAIKMFTQGETELAEELLDHITIDAKGMLLSGLSDTAQKRLGEIANPEE